MFTEYKNIEEILKAIQKKEIIKTYSLEDVPEGYIFLRSAKEINGVLSLNVLDFSYTNYSEKIVFLFKKIK